MQVFATIFAIIENYKESVYLLNYEQKTEVQTQTKQLCTGIKFV